MEFRVGTARIRIVQRDITDIEADAIVNAANSSLMGGGGVDGAIHRRGGPEILEQCKRIRSKEWPSGLPTGKAVMTSGGRLKARYVIHTVGPVWCGGSSGEADLLAEAYVNSLRLAVLKRLKTVVFPSISTGAYRYPFEQASRIAVNSVKQFLETEDQLEEVTFVLFRESDFSVFLNVASTILK